jgi:hypothetical protein
MSAERIDVKQVAPESYFADRDRWDALVAASGADPLFNGWSWQASWWAAFGTLNRLEPVFLEARLKGRVAGRLSLVRSRARVRGVSVETLQLLGNLARGPTTIRSEFMDAICDPMGREDVTTAMLEFVATDVAWDELMLTDLTEQGALDMALDRFCLRHGTYHRRYGPEMSYEVRIEGPFEDFKSRLSESARRRMFGQRRRLVAKGRHEALRLEEEPFSNPRAASVLDALHEKRWGAPLLGAGRAEFFRCLAGNLPLGALRVSTLRVSDRAISALLNVRIGQRESNIQGGFDALSCQGLSPSRLHWGMLLEEAFKLGSPEVFDLLVGRGRRDDFKADFCRPVRSCLTRHIVRRGWLSTGLRARKIAARCFGVVRA